MGERKISNGKIMSADLSIADHGLLDCSLGIKCYGFHQGFGGYKLSGIGEDLIDPNDFNYAAIMIVRILEVVGVDKWSRLVGQPVRIDSDWNGIYRIGNFLEDDWFDPKEVFGGLKELRKDGNE